MTFANGLRWLLASLLLMLTSCGGQSAAPGQPAAPQGGLQLLLPAPSQLRTARFTLAEGAADGADYDPLKPNNRVSVAANDGIFAPSTAINPSPTGLAYAIYDFHLPNYAGELVDLDFDWTSAPAAGSAFIGLANFGSDRWHWIPLPADNSLSFPGIAQYRNPADHLYLAVAVSGTVPATLTFIQLSMQQAPEALLTSDVDSGTAPLTVSFDASGSSDSDGSIVSYEWDFNGDSNFTQTVEEVAAFNTATPAPVTYDNPGSYNVQVRVTDDDGKSDLATLQINVTLSPPPVAALSGGPATTGPKPLAVDFDATGSTDDGTITDYEWDFDGDGNYNEAGNGELAARGDATPPTYTYTAVGSYTARVRVTDNDNGSDVEQLTISVINTPPLADLQADVLEMDAPLMTTLIATGSSDPGGSIVDYEWDFDGDGVYNEPGIEADDRGNAISVPQTYGLPGIYTINLRVTDDDGATATDSIQVTAHGWRIVTVWNELVGWCDFALVNGNPAVAWKRTNNTLAYSRSVTLLGTSPSDWITTDLPNPTLTAPGRDLCLAAVGSGAAIAYTESPGTEDLYYQYGSGNATSIIDWTNPILVHDTADGISTGYSPDILVVGGQPMIFYDHNFDLHCVRASTATGSSAGDWSGTKVLIDSTGNNGSALLVGGNPAVAYFRWDGVTEHASYCRSSDALGDQTTDWATKVDLSNHSALSISLQMVGSNPAVCYIDSLNSSLHYVRASNATGGSWPAAINVHTGTSIYGWSSSLAFVNGVPQIVAFDQNNFDLEYFRSSTADGAAAGNWSHIGTVDGATSSSGWNGEILAVDGKPAVAYRDATNGHMKYAIRL